MRRRQTAMLTVEMMLTLPILLVVALAIIEFSMMLIGMQAVSAAAHAGVREASLPGSSASSVVQRVNDALDSWSFQNDVDVLIFVNNLPADGAPLVEAQTGDEVSVTVRVGAAKVAPNALLIVGISIAGKELEQTFVMRKE